MPGMACNFNKFTPQAKKNNPFHNLIEYEAANWSFNRTACVKYCEAIL